MKITWGTSKCICRVILFDRAKNTSENPVYLFVCETVCLKYKKKKKMMDDPFRLNSFLQTFLSLLWCLTKEYNTQKHKKEQDLSSIDFLRCNFWSPELIQIIKCCGFGSISDPTILRTINSKPRLKRNRFKGTFRWFRESLNTYDFSKLWISAWFTHEFDLVIVKINFLVYQKNKDSINRGSF